MNDNRRHDNDRSRESRARQDAYQEYLSLREHNEDRGSYVKDLSLIHIWFLDPEVIDAFKDDFYTKYPELQEKKIILFAPTYRGAEQKYAYYDYSKLDFQRIYEFCQKEDAVFLIKMHPFVKTLPEIPELLQDRIWEFSRFPDINKLYYVTDLLITDYSSNYFEYALLQRPVVFYTYDREFYELTRGCLLYTSHQ